MVNWKNLFKRIPSRVQLSSKVFYEIVWTDAFKDGHTLGETRLNIKQIVIKNDDSNRESVHTFLHEVLHAISEEYDVGLTEPQVRKLEKALYYVLKKGNIFKDE